MAEMSGELTAAVTLPDFLSTHEVGTLTVADRQLIVEQALLVLEQTYALLPFKVGRYGINPLQRLRLMQTRLGRPGQPGPEWRFHAELVDIFNSLRDLHTRYTLPQPFTRAGAVLPFLLKEFTEGGRRRYLVGARFVDQADLGEHFQFGVEVPHWNGVPIGRAVDRVADRFPGANAEARHARAVEFFTTRSLAFGPPPDEDWITVDYVDLRGQARQTRLVWDVRSLVPAENEAAVEDADTPLGFDLEGIRLARLRTALFAPEFIAAERSGEPVVRGDDFISVTPAWSTFFEARRRVSAGVTFGHLRIRSFLTTDVLGFIGEFVRLLGELPPDGLVLDVRGNLGGAIVGAELCLQALTGRPVQPEPAQFAATLLTLKICRALNLEAWLPSLEQALESGAPYSAAVPFTPAELLDRMPQTYFGPVVLVTDARCYSAADIFAAGFQDNKIGRILGIDGNTGAGGGNIWVLKDLLEKLPPGGATFRPMAGGAALSVVIRRMLRVGDEHAGTPLEDYGVVPDEQHAPTRADIMNDDADLMAAAAALLADGKARRFDVSLAVAAGEVTASFAVLGIDRADVVVDGRPRLTVDLGGNPAPTVVPDAATAQLVRVVGYDAGQPVALRTFDRVGDSLTLRTTFNL
jgi:hypothetical protein